MANQVQEYLGRDGKSVSKAKATAFADRLRQGKNADTANANTKPFLGTNKAGVFVYGQANEPVKPGTLWAFDIMTAATGYAYWYNKKKTEKMASIWSDPVILDDLGDPDPAHDDKGNKIEWAPAYTWNRVMAVHGPHKGLEVVYSSNALYGRRVSEKLMDACADRAETNPDSFIPIVNLTNEPYDHKTHGMLNSHQVELVAWGNLEGEIVEWVTEKPAIEAPKPKTRQRRQRRAA